MSLDCTEWHEQIWLWLENDLEDTEIDALKAHLKTCAECRQELARQNQLSQLLAASPAISPAPGFSVRFQERLERRRLRTRTWLGISTLTLFAAATMIGLGAALVISGAGWWQALPLQSLLNTGIKASIVLGESAVTMFSVILLISKAVARGLNQPAFAIYSLLTAVLAMVWVAVIGTRSSRLVPVTIDTRSYNA